ncbi:MAG: DUF11 domain-containing protein [Acidobacteria bacterium]|nr:DUF11 domain-containing protein [Acidobacteriota bacterium]
MTYTIVVSNAGPSDAQSVQLTDPFPSGTAVVSVSGTGALSACAANGAGTALNCPAVTLGAGQSATVTVVAKVGSGTTGPLQNTATVTWTDNDGNPNDNTSSSTATTTVNRKADLAIEKKATPEAVSAGNEITYTIKVTNNGPSTVNANEYQVSDTLPAQTTYVSSSLSAPGFNCTGGSAVFPCTGTAVLTPGQSATISFKLKVDPNFAPAPGFVVNTATVGVTQTGTNAGLQDTNPTNDSSTTSTAVGPNADLQVTKTSSPAMVTAGGTTAADTITYTINYRNSGPGSANGVQIVDTIPANLTLVPGSFQAPNLSCTPVPAPGQQVTCTPVANGFGTNAAGVLPAGASGTITFQARVPAGVPDGTLIQNTVTIASTGPNATPDPNTSNNASPPTSTLVKATADLGVRKVSSTTSIDAGGTFDYTVYYRNNGPSNAANVVITDTLPAQTTFVSLANANPNLVCTTPVIGQTGTVICTMPVLAPGALSGIFPQPGELSFTIKVKANPDVAGSTVLANRVTIASSTTDPNPGDSPNATSANQSNNDNLANVTVNSTAAVKLRKQVTGLGGNTVPNFSAGELISYTIAVENPGPSDGMLGASGITDTVPAGTTFHSFGGGTGILGGAACSMNGANTVLTCLPSGKVPAGTTFTANQVTLILRIQPNYTPGPLTNTVTANVTNNDPQIGPNPTGSATVVVVRETDLAIDKTGPEFVSAGETFVYTLKLTNRGPSDASTGVKVSDTLPAGVTYQGTTISGPGGFTCSLSSPVVNCTSAATLPAGSVTTFSIQVRANANLAQNSTLRNLAAVTAAPGDQDNNPSNNNDEFVSVVTTGADLQLRKFADRTTVTSGTTGNQIVYTVEIVNNGPSNASLVMIEDQLPANVTFDTGFGTGGFIVTPLSSFSPNGMAPTPPQPTGASCSINPAGSNRIVCTVDNSGNGAGNDMIAGQRLQVQYRVSVPAGVPLGTAIVNAARVASFGPNNATPDPNAANNAFGVQVAVSQGADLSISKAVDVFDDGTTFDDNGDPVIAGQIVDYRLTINNQGPSDAANVVVTDTLPANARFISVNTGNSGFVCSPPAVGTMGGTLSCSRAILPPGVTNQNPAPANLPPVTIIVRVQVDPSIASGNVINSASVSSSTPDPGPGANSSSVSNPVNTSSMVDKFKSASPDPVIAGENLTYTLTIVNRGQSDAQNVVLTDVLPSFTSFVSWSGSGAFAAPATCTINGSTLTCKPQGGSAATPPDGILRAGATGTLTVVVKVASDAPETVGPNSFSLASSTPGVAGSSNAVTTKVIHKTDLAITKTAPSEVVAGSNIDYVLTVRNNGSSSFTNGTIHVTDTLPSADMMLVSATSTGPGILTNAFTCTQTGGVINCDYNVPPNAFFPPDGVATIVLKIKAPNNVIDGANFNNRADVGIINDANDPTDTNGDPMDMNPGNNSSQASSAVRTLADLELVKDVISPAPPAQVKAGENITYRLRIRNNGPSNAQNVRLEDIIPGNTVFLPGTITYGVGNLGFTAGSCIYNSPSTGAPQGSLTCVPNAQPAAIPPTAAGELVSSTNYDVITFQVTVNPSVIGGTLSTNQARALTTTNDPNSSNNTSLATSTATNAASQLTITKVVQSAVTTISYPSPAGPVGPASTSGTLALPGTGTTSVAVIPGTTMTYNLVVTNNGPSDILSPQIVDVLPAGVTFVSARKVSGNGTYNCSNFGSNVSCVAPMLPAPQNGVGNTATIEVVVRIDPSVKTALVNNATIEGTTNGFNTPIGAATQLTTPVQGVSDLVTTKTHTPDPVVAGTKLRQTIS